jgi:hypothetical protein
VPPGLLVGLLLGDDGTGRWWDVTVPNGAREIIIAFLTGLFAGMIFRHRGKLIGALAQLVPAVGIISAADLVHALQPAERSAFLFFAALGLVPAILGGSYGVRWSARRSTGLDSLRKASTVWMKAAAKVIGVLFLVVWIVTNLALLFNFWRILTGWLGTVPGTLVALFACPGALIFPLIYWFVEQSFPVLYFELWGLWLISAGVGWGLLAWSFADGESVQEEDYRAGRKSSAVSVNPRREES